MQIPLAQILSVGMMLRYSFNMGQAADDIERAITEVLDEGWRTGDIADEQPHPIRLWVPQRWVI